MGLESGHSVGQTGGIRAARRLAPLLPWRVHYGYVMLLLGLAVVTAALGLGRWAYPPILPSMKEGLGLNYTQAGLISTAEMVGYTVFALVCGVLASRVGPRKVITAGLFLVGGGMVLAGLAPSFEVALLTRLLTGIGAAGANIAMLSLVSRWFARSRRGLAMGIYMAGSPMGVIVVGQAVPRILIAGGAEGWRQSWLYLGLVVLGVALAAATLLRNHPREKGLLPLWAKGEANGNSVPGPTVGRGGLRAVCRQGCVWHLALIYAAHGFAYVSYAAFFASHLGNHGLTPLQVGDLWAMVGIIAVLFQPTWGFVSDLIGRRRGLMLVFALEASALVVFALAGELTFFVVSVVLYAGSASGPGTIVLASVGDYLDDSLVPTALGLTSVFFGAAMALAPAVTGAVADAVGSFTPALLLGAAVSLSGAGAAFLLRPPRLAVAPAA